MLFFYRFLDLLSRKTRVVILIPCISSIGNCAEQIRFGLIKARREGKRLLIVHPFDLPWKFSFPIVNREILNLASPFRVRLPSMLQFAARFLLTCLYAPLRIAGKIIGKLTGFSLPSMWTRPAIGIATLWQPKTDMEGFDWAVVESYRWPDELRRPLPIGLPPDRLADAGALRRAMGLPADAWFACLHVREGGYYNDYESTAPRNADIRNYLQGMKVITDRGGWVLRMGDKSMKPLPAMPQVIDYPHTRFKSDLMDMHLLSECKFYIGMPSGILDVAFLFQRPMVLTNMTNWTFVYPRRAGDRGILKHVYSRPQKRFLSVQELLGMPWEAQLSGLPGIDFELHENTPEEIRDVILEFLDGGDSAGQSDLQQECNRRRIEQGKRSLSQPLMDDHFHDMLDRYRLASRLDSSLGTLGQRYLNANWQKDSLT